MPFDLPPVLKGELLELRPLRADDFEALFAVAADPLIWEQHPARDRHQEEQFRIFFRESLESGGALVAIDTKDGRIIGSSRFHGYDGSEVEIGWTFLARSHWGGRYNGEMKRLMLRHAFRFVDRVVFLVGPDNRRSQLAVEKVGGVRVGSKADGSGRESIVYQITAAAFRQVDDVEGAIRIGGMDSAALIERSARTTLRIRRATDSDCSSIWTTHVRAIREVCSLSYSADQIAAWAGLLSPDSYTEVIRERFFVVAEDAGGIIGFGQLDQAAGEVDAVYVLPGRQGEGIGRALLRSLEDEARSVGLRRLHLSATLNAIPFYKSAGYVGQGAIAHRLPTGVELECLRMAKELGSS